MPPRILELLSRVGLTILLVVVPGLSVGAADEGTVEPSAVKLLHEGTLTASDGTPVQDGHYDLTLYMWSDVEGGHLLAREDRSGVRVTAGRFLVELEAELPPWVDSSELWIEAEMARQVVVRRAVEASSSSQSTRISEWNVSASRFDIPFSADATLLGQNGDLFVANEGGAITFWTNTSDSFGVKLALEIAPTGHVVKQFGDDAKLTVGHSGFLILGKPSETNLVLDNNEIMARNNGSTSDLYLQHQGGDVLVNGNMVQTSDLRKKENVQPLDAGLAEVLRLRPVSYEWIGRKDGRQVGLVAQEVRDVVEEVVHEDEDGTLGIAYSNLVPLLIQAIQDQQTEIEELRVLVERMRARPSEPTEPSG